MDVDIQYSTFFKKERIKKEGQRDRARQRGRMRNKEKEASVSLQPYNSVLMTYQIPITELCVHPLGTIQFSPEIINKGDST